ncbi:MAG: ABC transporter permease [Acidobacteria bacterium]|nr:ABC transporter permease [Acidobacteriota bacterium]
MARVRFGGATQVQEALREQAGFPWLETAIQDIGGALRYFGRNRGFFAVAIVILALGIGATTAVFSVAETLLFRPLPYPESDRLVTLRSIDTMSDYPSTRVAPGLLADWQIKATSFEAIAGYRWATVDLIDGAQSDRLSGLLATPESFDVFGVPLLGRSFRAEDRGAKRPFESTDTGETLVLGNEVWRRRFDADEALVGGAVDLHILNFSRVGPTRYTVVGVATAPVRFPPLEADFQLGDSNVIDTIDFWMPQFVSATQLGEPRSGDSWFDVVARLRPGVTLAQAQAEMDVIARLEAEQYSETNRGRKIRVVPLREHIPGEARNGLLLLSAGTAMLLLIACSNVATLLLARGLARRREVAIRTALGAPWWRIVRQFLMEALILAACAGLLGVLLAAWAINVTRPWMPQSLPLLQEMGINLTVLVFALTSAVVTACITGLAPAFRSARADGAPLTSLVERGVTLGKSHSRLVGVLVSAEVALTVVLLVGAGLLVRSAFRASQVETGFNPDNLLTMTISLPANKFDWDHNAVFVREAIEAVRSLSSISDAAVVHGVPMVAGDFSVGRGTIEGYVPPNDTEKLTYSVRVVSPGYFATMQIPIVAGRSFEARDEEGQRGAARSILVSESFAKRYWPGRDPLGRYVSFGEAFRDWKMTVVGVAGDVRYSGLEMGPTIDLYLPQALFPQRAITLIARTRGDPLNEAPAVRERIRAVDQHAFLADIRSMDQLIAGSQAERRAGTLLVSAFGPMALVLVVAGVYSVIMQAVVGRRLDLAIRSALGAGPRRVVATAMRTALQPAAVGIALGALAALGVTRVMTSLLFEVSALDIVTWVGGGIVILTACVAASYVPARRAARIDPMAALRAE